VILLQLLDPLGVILLVSFVREFLVACFPIALVKAVALSVPLVASDDAGGIEGGSGAYDLMCEKLFVNCFAIPCADKILVFHY